ncbi:MAG TPA: VTT domain-containing protein [Planctomycetota bacterium]|jgi:membrane protein DedA with SNARE-associated domain/rhodanese-related sulfurtransferase|nr:VTT domain-containing protein [Planctomycetota bacterium]
MESSTHFLATYCTLIIFLVAFANQVGAPLALELVLLQLGALVAGGKLGPWEALLPPLLGTVLGNLVLYDVGRRSGLKLLNVISRYSLEPRPLESEARRRFGRWGLKFLLVSQFFPLSSASPVLAGMTRLRFAGYLGASTVGAAIWVAVYVAAGYLWSHQVEFLVHGATQVTGTLVGAAVLILAGWVALKLIRRSKILRVHHRARISPELLKSKLDTGLPVLVVDVRSRRSMDEFPYVIPGALVMPEEEIDGRRAEIPTDRELVVYCDCPNDLMSARVAIKLNREGLERIHALEGGIDAWRALGFPTIQATLVRARA